MRYCARTKHSDVGVAVYSSVLTSVYTIYGTNLILLQLVFVLIQTGGPD